MITVHSVSIDGENREENISINTDDIAWICGGDGTKGLKQTIGAKCIIAMSTKDMK